MEAINALNAYQKAVNTAAIVSIADKNGIITYVNDLFCKVSKHTKKELIGANHRIISSGHHPESFFKELWNTISSGKVWQGEVKNKTKDGDYYWVDTTISPIFDNEGKISHYLSIRSLITERKNLEKEREQMLVELTQKYDELMQFNYIVSHNLRAPLANILTLTHLIGSENEKQADLIGMILSSASSIDTVLNDLTNLLTIRNPITKKKELFSIRALLKFTLDSLSLQIAESKATIIDHISDDADSLCSIKVYFQSIIYNLVSNSIKYRIPGMPPVITIKTSREENAFTLSVTDNGCGMDLAQVGDKLFGLYKRFNSSQEGRGIGLHLTKTQVESMGGKIEVESTPGKGTTFKVRIKDLFL